MNWTRLFEDAQSLPRRPGPTAHLLCSDLFGGGCQPLQLRRVAFRGSASLGAELFGFGVIARLLWRVLCSSLHAHYYSAIREALIHSGGPEAARVRIRALSHALTAPPPSSTRDGHDHHVFDFRSSRSRRSSADPGLTRCASRWTQFQGLGDKLQGFSTRRGGMNAVHYFHNVRAREIASGRWKLRSAMR